MLELLVGGKRYGGWKSATVTRSIEAISGSFRLAVSERWAGQVQLWPITENDECSLLLHGVPVLTGYVDTREPAFSATSHEVAVSGRDRTADLVDSSCVLDKWEFRHVSALTLAQKLCAPYGIDVSLQAGLVLENLPKKVSIDPGETVGKALEDVCRLAGVLIVADGSGGLVLTRSAAARCVTDLVEGKNITDGSAKFDMTGRFRTYLVLGSHKGSNEINGAAAASIKGFAEDLDARANRTAVVRPESGVTAAQAKVRAQWEAAVRAARGDSATISVVGWQQGDGSLWPINALTHLRSPKLEIDGDMLITQATYTLDTAGGTKTQLTLRRPDAFTPKPQIKTTGAGSGLWKEIAKGV